MPIHITRAKGPKSLSHMKMRDMLKYTDRIFQQYYNGIPQKIYYVNCGIHEKNLVTIWYSAEDNKYRLSTDNAKSLRDFYKDVTVIDVTEEINIDIKII